MPNVLTLTYSMIIQKSMKTTSIKNYIILTSILLTIVGCNGGSGKKPTTRPIKPPEVSLPVAKVTYSVYVENSASMDGYMNGVTKFKTAIYSYLSDIKIADLASSIHLNYINSQKISFGSNIADFIEKLDPTTFRARGGGRGTTDIANVLKMVLHNTSENNVSLLISDFIFSPGSGKDAEQYLINQQIGIKNSMAEHLKKFPNHAVLIYHLESEFDGTYYNKFDKPSRFKGNRPYYIWIVGKKALVSNLISKCPVEQFKGSGVKNIFSITKKELPVKFAIQFGSGNFKPDKKDPQKSIVDAKKDDKGIGEKKLRFNVNVDFSGLLMDDAYLLDVANYEVSDKDYQLQIQKNNNSNGYSHTLKLSTLIVKPATVSIRLKSQVPAWVDDISDGSGININAAANKTYGFKYLVYGIYEAFTKDSPYCADIKVNINQIK